MYQLTNSPDVLLNVETNTFIHRQSASWPTEWLESNSPALPPPSYEPHSPEYYRAIRTAAWAWMASVVQERGYDSIETCVGYFNSGVDRYRLEARAMVAWRDAVNQALEALVKAPPAGVETWDQVRALLPQPGAYSWPTKEELPLDGVPPVTLPVD